MQEETVGILSLISFSNRTVATDINEWKIYFTNTKFILTVFLPRVSLNMSWIPWKSDSVWILLLILFSLMEVLVCRDNVYPLPSVLQFVPRNVDVGFCNFSQRIEKGLTMALKEVSKHQEFYNFTVQVRRWACFVSVPFCSHLWLSRVSSSQ